MIYGNKNGALGSRFGHRTSLNPTKLVIIALALGFVSQVACKSTYAERRDQIREVNDIVVDLRETEPDLPLFNDLETIATSAFANRTEEETDLLMGRLYYDALERVKNAAVQSRSKLATGDVLRRRVRQALSSPLPPERLERSYYSQMLDETRARAAEDPSFASALRASAQQARINWDPAWDNFRCIVDGVESPSSLCRALVMANAYQSIRVTF